MRNPITKVGAVLMLLGLAWPAWARDVRQESSVLAELGFDHTTGTASAVLRGASTSATCAGSRLLLDVSTPAAELLHALLVSAHLGERKVAIWFDLDASCQITQAQLVD